MADALGCRGGCSLLRAADVNQASRAFLDSRKVTAVSSSDRKKCSGRLAAVRAGTPEADNEVTLLDYGGGNVRSIRNAIHLLGYNIRDVSSAKDIENAKRLVFPGVGAFSPAMEVLDTKGLADPLRDYLKQDRPFLGICLGLQLMFEYSEEHGYAEGLGTIPGAIARFDTSDGLQVPHIGWNGLQLKQRSEMLEAVNGHHVYFVHSYRAVPSEANNDWVLATSDYGGEFIAAVKKGNVHAVQFHPEKSGAIGLDILRRFLDGGQDVEPERVAHFARRPSLTPAKTLSKRVIACLDVRSNDNGDLVVTKGDQYDVREQGGGEVRNLGKPVELAGQYFKDGADEVTFLNITGFRDFPLGDLPMLEVLRQASKEVFVPLTVGGGIRDFIDKEGRHYSSLEVASEYFRSGADKVSIGSDAVYAAEDYLQLGKKTGKTSLEQISSVYGNQAVVVSIDPRRQYVRDPAEVPYKTVKVSKPGPNSEEYAWYQCTVNGGREGRPIGAYELAKAVEVLGAGEILLNCIDCDGKGEGFDMDLVAMVSDAVSIPVIASSGAGKEEHFSEVFHRTKASAALAAGIFHKKKISISAVKEHLVNAGVEMRFA